jgi:hypothetical protein
MTEKHMNDPLLDITSAALTAVAEMTVALNKLNASIKKSRSDFESDLIGGANWSVDQCSEYSKLLHEPAHKRKLRIQELLKVPEIALLNPPNVGIESDNFRDIPHVSLTDIEPF